MRQASRALGSTSVVQDGGQGFSPGVIRASFGRSAKAFDRAAKRGEPLAIPFGRYLLLDRIKRGGMAEVYRAKAVGHEGFEKIVAIKRILPHLAQNEDFVTMFIDEAKIVSYLNHQNICPVIELGRCEDGLYIVMEYIWGRDLRQILNALARTGRLMPLTVAIYIAARICEGLDYAHRRTGPMGQPLDLVHRDISPQNVLISFDGEVKIIDFGIASASQRSTETRAGTFKGKFAYMSPEQARGHMLDRRSDIFAAGILLHEMITGTRLFAGKTDLETLDRVRNCEVPRPARPFEEVPAELVDIVMRALARQPDDRFSWAGEMQETLDRYLLLSGELASASRLGTWICINFSEEAAKALVDQERAARAKPPGAKSEDSGSGSGYGMKSSGPPSGHYSAQGGEPDLSASSSVSVSESIAEPISRSVSAVVDELEFEVDEDAFGGVPLDVDDDAFGSPSTPASGVEELPSAEHGEPPPEASDPGVRPVRTSAPAPSRPPTSPPDARDAERPTAPPPTRQPAPSGAPPPARPRTPPSGSHQAVRPAAPPPSGAYDVRQDSSVNIKAHEPSPRVHDNPNKRKRRRLDPVEVEYSPWTRYVPNPSHLMSPPDPTAPPDPSDPGVRVSAEEDPGDGGELIIVDEPPPPSHDDDDSEPTGEF